MQELCGYARLFPSTPNCGVAAENTEPFSSDDSNLLVLAEELKSRRNTGSYLCGSEPSRCVRPARCCVALPTCEQILKNVTAEREAVCFKQQFNIILGK